MASALSLEQRAPSRREGGSQGFSQGGPGRERPSNTPSGSYCDARNSFWLAQFESVHSYFKESIKFFNPERHRAVVFVYEPDPAAGTLGYWALPYAREIRTVIAANPRC